MITYFSETLQIAVHCVTSLGPRRQLVCGWVMTPRGTPLDLRVMGDSGREHRPSFRLLYARPDVVPGDPEVALVSGFTLVVDEVADTAPLELVLASDGAGGRVNLLNPAISRDLHALIGSQDWAINFRLLRAEQERHEVLNLFAYQYRPYGAFDAWMARLPLVKQRAENSGLMAEIQASASPAGEIMLGIRFTGRPLRQMQIEPLVIGALRAADGGPDTRHLLPLVDQVSHQAANFAACYGRVAADVLPRLRGLEIIAQVTFDEQVFWLRCHPAEHQVPRFLDGVAAMPGPGMDTGFAVALLNQVLACREAGLKPELDRVAALAPPPPGPPGTPDLAMPPGLAVMVGVDDPLCMPLLEVLADRLEARCGGLMLIGKRAEQAAQVFQRRGRLPATTEGDAALALGRAAEQGASVIPLDPQRLARAVIEGDLDRLFAERLEGSDLALLRGLHAAAGCSADLADTLNRLIRLRGGAGPGWQPGWQPPAHAWASPIAAHLVNAHLERLWTLPAPAMAAGG